jgi:hypothetical protein
VGRHTVPGSGQPTPDRGFWVRLAVAVVALALVATYLLTRGDGGTTSTVPSAAGSPSPTATESSSAPAPASASPSDTGTSAAPASPTAGPSATERPPTLSFVVRRQSYITVRVPGGRTLVSRLYRPGQTRSFDQMVLQVVNGRPSAVDFPVTGKPRKPGPADQTETFTVRRK